MKKKTVIAFMGVLMLFIVVGCRKPEENRKGETTKPTVGALNDTPVPDWEVTPSAVPEITDSIPGTGETPYEVIVSFREETEEETDGDFVYFKSSLYYPVFEGKYAENMNRFVASVTEKFREALPEAKERAKFDYEDSLLGEYIAPIFPEEEEFSVTCLWEKEQYMTLFTKCVSNTGGAHPNVYCQAYVVNLTNGCPESLERMLEPYGITVETLVEYTTEKIREEHGENLYDYDDKRELEKNVYRFLQEHQWYFNDEGLVVFANPYEIAAYAYGMIECEISYEELEEGLKK